MRSNKKDQPIGDVLSNLGFAFEIFKAIAHPVMARGGTMQHLRRVLKEKDLQKQIAELIVPASSMADKPLGNNEYLVHVGYDMPRDKLKLESEFSNDGVSNVFYGNYEWQKHSSCVGIDETPGNRIILEKQFTEEEIEEMGGLESENIISYMDVRGYRPATHLETYAFGINPETRNHQLQGWIIGLGSFTVGGDYRRVAGLDADDGGRVFYCRWFGSEWNPSGRFLFVRK